jgi:hypothetical protein
MAKHDGVPDQAAARAHRTLQVVRSTVRPGSFPLLLLALGFLYVLNGLAIESPAGSVLLTGGRIAVLCAGLYVLSAHRVTLLVGVLIGAAILTFEAGWWSTDRLVGRVLQDSIATGFLVWILAVVLHEVFDPATVERDAVVGALCGFVIILLVFTRLHGLLEASIPGSYHVEGPPLSERPDAVLNAVFQYFSTVTATTVGFGDIVPMSPAARTATGVEAVVGQVYLAVVIATLVGRVVARQE